MLDLIGLVSGLITIIAFGESFTAEKPDEKEPNSGWSKENPFGITLRIHAGLNGTKDPDFSDSVLEGAGGRVGNIVHEDNVGNIIVATNILEEIVDGYHADAKVWTKNGRQATTTTVWGNAADPICIATMGITFSDDTKFGWTGDWGKICNLPVFYSGIVLSNGVVPYCTWLSFPGVDATPAHMLSIEWAKFKVEDGDEGSLPSYDEAQQFCGSAFKAWNADDGLGDQLHQILSPSKDMEPTKRSLPKSRRSDDRLIISSRANMPATTICEMENSYGPDYISTEEGVYCNMHSRSTLPLCGPGVLGECFDLDTASHVHSNGKQKRTLQARNPSSIVRWN